MTAKKLSKEDVWNLVNIRTLATDYFGKEYVASGGIRKSDDLCTEFIELSRLKEVVEDLKQILNEHYTERVCHFSNTMLPLDNCICEDVFKWLEKFSGAWKDEWKY